MVGGGYGLEWGDWSALEPEGRRATGGIEEWGTL